MSDVITMHRCDCGAYVWFDDDTAEVYFAGITHTADTCEAES